MSATTTLFLVLIPCAARVGGAGPPPAFTEKAAASDSTAQPGGQKLIFGFERAEIEKCAEGIKVRIADARDVLDWPYVRVEMGRGRITRQRMVLPAWVSNGDQMRDRTELHRRWRSLPWPVVRSGHSELLA